MYTSAVLGYALVADSDTVILVSTIGAAVIGAIVTLVTTMMNIASANRRQRRELQYRGRQPSVIGFPFVVTVILIAAVIYLATRPTEEAKVASEAPVPETTVFSAPTATTPAAAPACAARTVQIAALEKPTAGSTDFEAASAEFEARRTEFEAQAQLLMNSLPQLGELHSDDGAACGVRRFRQFYFGPFPNGDAARDACFAIGLMLHANGSMFTGFHSDAGLMNYPYYRVEPGVSVKDSDGNTLLCSPAA